jgi:hypothetical protein
VCVAQVLCKSFVLDKMTDDLLTRSEDRAAVNNLLGKKPTASETDFMAEEVAVCAQQQASVDAGIRFCFGSEFVEQLRKPINREQLRVPLRHGGPLSRHIAACFSASGLHFVRGVGDRVSTTEMKWLRKGSTTFMSLEHKQRSRNDPQSRSRVLAGSFTTATSGSTTFWSRMRQCTV